MAETFLFNITEEVLSKVSSLALAEISLACSTKSEVNKLHNTLSTIKAVLLDANEQQTKNHELRDWLEKLKDAVYDADDLMDDLSTGVSPRKTQNSISVLEKVSRFFSCSNPLAYRFKIGHRISQIRKRLDEIAADRKNFHLTEQAYINPIENRERDQTHSFVTASDIIGRDYDKKFVIQLLLSTNDDEHVSVIPIVGLGGLGKTTLVKLVYNDDQIIQEGLQHFTSLRVLRIYECQRLTSLPKSIKYLTALEKLWIWNCDELNFIEGEGLEGLKSLQSLLLMGLPKMVSMPVGLKETAAKTLKFFRIANCASLTTLPDWFLDFSLLQRLYVEDCPSLSFLPEGLQNLNAKILAETLDDAFKWLNKINKLEDKYFHMRMEDRVIGEL
ncbi:putative disease resistance protein RGA1 [Forsythia ovata]|uniref:Disease resistance protein RGA1 n=1 Tax=Forsythia ovata TaxID=205694 RepID=A0ABD1SM80_9LAMI